MADLDLMMNDRFEEGQNMFNFVIHIRLRQRNKRKTITSVEGIPEEFDYNRILRYWKKMFNCTGTIVEEDD